MLKNAHYVYLSSVVVIMQMAAEYEELYWAKVHSLHNEVIDLMSIVKPGSTIFTYAQHCHEATLALALALHNTNRGEKLPFSNCIPGSVKRPGLPQVLIK